MSHWTLEIQLGLTQILAVNALLVAWFVSRLNSLPRLVEQVRLLRQVRQKGWIDSSTTRAWYARWTEAVGRAVSACGVLWVLWNTYHFLSLTNLLVGSLTFDHAMLERIRSHANNAREEAVVTGFLVAIVMFSEVLIAMVLHGETLAETDIPKLHHTYVVPPGNEGSLDALWEERFQRAAASLPAEDQVRGTVESALSNGAWRRSWPDWAASVGVFREVTEASSQDRARTAR